MKDCTHEFLYDQPEELAKLMIGFFEGTIKGKFEPKPRYEIACAPFPAPIPKSNNI